MSFTLPWRRRVHAAASTSRGVPGALPCICAYVFQLLCRHDLPVLGTAQLDRGEQVFARGAAAYEDAGRVIRDYEGAG